jgi:hypothetical protein
LIASASALMSSEREAPRVRLRVEELERVDLVLVLFDELLEVDDERLAFSLASSLAPASSSSSSRPRRSPARARA